MHCWYYRSPVKREEGKKKKKKKKKKGKFLYTSKQLANYGGALCDIMALPTNSSALWVEGYKLIDQDTNEGAWLTGSRAYIWHRHLPETDAPVVDIAVTTGSSSKPKDKIYFPPYNGFQVVYDEKTGLPVNLNSGIMEDVSVSPSPSLPLSLSLSLSPGRVHLVSAPL